MENDFINLGGRIRDLLEKYGYSSVAVKEF
jgi:hypothetical protein